MRRIVHRRQTNRGHVPAPATTAELREALWDLILAAQLHDPEDASLRLVCERAILLLERGEVAI